MRLLCFTTIFSLYFPSSPTVLPSVHAGCTSPKETWDGNWHSMSPYVYRHPHPAISRQPLQLPLRGVRIKGLKSISVSGSNHICMVMILVDTIPGSAAFTTIPLCLTRLAKSMVNRVNASFVLLYIGMRQKPPFLPRRKNPESQDDRWHTYKIPYSQYGSLSHQWQQLAGQQVRPYIIDTHRPFQSVFGNAAFRFHGSGIVHQQRQRLSPLQQMLCKCGH